MSIRLRLHTLLLAGAMTVVLTECFLWGAGSGGFWAAALCAGAAMVWIFFNHGSWILKDLQAQPVQPQEAPEIYSILEALSQKNGVRVPQLYGIASASANIFSLHQVPRPAIVLTLGGAEHLNPEELEGILAYEMVKLRRGMSLWTGLAVTALKGIRIPVKILRTFFCFGNMTRSREPDNPLVLLLSYLFLPLEMILFAWMHLNGRITAGDAEAAELTNPLYLASALRRLETQTLRFPFRHLDRIYGPLFAIWPGENASRGWKRLWDTHPAVSRRILCLEKAGSESQRASLELV